MCLFGAHLLRDRRADLNERVGRVVSSHPLPRRMSLLNCNTSTSGEMVTHPGGVSGPAPWADPEDAHF